MHYLQRISNTMALSALLMLPAGVMAQAAKQTSPQTSALDAYPSKPIVVIIPVAAGPTDAEFRIFLPRLAEIFSHPFILDNKPGAGQSIGTAIAAKAAADGYTLLLTNGSFTVHPNFYPDLNYNIIRDFEPVTQLTERATVFVVSPVALPNVHNLKELVAWGKANPGKLNCGTSGRGSITHIVCASLAAVTNIPITAVHYKGGAQSQVDLIAGRNHFVAGNLLNSLSAVKQGKLRLIATLNPERSKVTPDIPTSLEQGFDVQYPSWLGVLVPAGTPPAIITKLHAGLRQTVLSPEVVKQLDQQGIVPVGSSPELFRKQIAAESARWKKIIQERGIKAED
jgi:tripartite-type tricarboxylate transporter receptor subunit TctC